MPWTGLDPVHIHRPPRRSLPGRQRDPGAKLLHSLAGRMLGSDFSYRDGWSMYHGKRVPGFPQHPHRGFETVTVVRRGFIDHSDSLGATARFGQGDTQWLTAGGGIQHSEMFPLRLHHGAQRARAVPDLAQPSPSLEDGAALLPHVVVRGDSNDRRRRRPSDDRRDRRAA